MCSLITIKRLSSYRIYNTYNILYYFARKENNIFILLFKREYLAKKSYK